MNPSVSLPKHFPRAALAALCAFVLGGSLYYLIEVLYRGFSHVTMWLCGGLCLVGILYIERYCARISLYKRALLSALLITVLEFLFGCVCNLWLHLDVWDYSHLPLNLLGQICLPFTAIWYVLSFPAALLCKVIRRIIRV